MKKTILCLLLFMLCTFSVQAVKADVYDSGIKEYRANNFVEAEKLFREAVSINPDNCRYRYYLAITLVQQEKYFEAERQYKKVIEISPGSEAAEKATKGLKLIADYKQKFFFPDTPTAMASVASGLTRTIIPINKNHSAIIVNNVILNKKTKANFFLDTGATYTSISRKTARILGIDLRHCRKISLKTVNGKVNVPLVTLDSININGVIAKNVDVTVHDLPAAKNITGLLGLSFLEQFKVTIDRKKERVILERS